MSKTVFLFGAGASTGAGHVLPCCPPLNAELFDSLARHYPKEWGPETQRWKHGEEFRQDFEAAYSRVILKIPHDDDAPRITLPTLIILEHQIPLARYFARFILDTTGEDLYSKLVGFLFEGGRIDECFFASLNYECLFEQALHRRGLRIDYFCDEARDEAIPVAKIHGSCNFITEKLSRRDKAMLSGPGHHYEIELICVPPLDVARTLEARMSSFEPEHFPIMTQISPGKEHHLAPVKVQQIRNAWAREARAASILVIIGVSPRPNDEHIWQPIRATPGRILYIGGEKDFATWRDLNSRFEFVAMTFEEDFRTCCDTSGGTKSMGYLYRPKLRSGKPGRIRWVKYYVKGRPIRESTGTEKETEARTFLKAHEGRVAMGQPVLPHVFGHIGPDGG